jgi:hypothetical protein
MYVIEQEQLDRRSGEHIKDHLDRLSIDLKASQRIVMNVKEKKM